MKNDDIEENRIACGRGPGLTGEIYCFQLNYHYYIGISPSLYVGAALPPLKVRRCMIITSDFSEPAHAFSNLCALVCLSDCHAMYHNQARH